MKALSQLLSAIPVIEVIGSDDKQITDVVSDFEIKVRCEMPRSYG